MTDWVSQKTAFQQRYNTIQDYYATVAAPNMSPLQQDLQTIASSKNQTDINTAIANIKTQQNNATQLNADITQAIQNYSNANDMDGLLQQNGQLQQQIAATQMRYDELLKDASTADVRSQNLRSSDTQISTHQVFLLGRPLRPASIPYLWALSILFICTALLLFYYYSSFEMPPIYILIAMATDLLYNPWFWSCLFGMASIVILFLVLRIVGKI
jgi:hypothetical protein